MWVFVEKVSLNGYFFSMVDFENVEERESLFLNWVEMDG